MYRVFPFAAVCLADKNGDGLPRDFASPFLLSFFPQLAALSKNRRESRALPTIVKLVR